MYYCILYTLSMNKRYKSINIDGHYHGLGTIGLRNIKDYQQNSKFSCLHINVRSLPDNFDKLKIFLTNLDNENIQLC